MEVEAFEGKNNDGGLGRLGNAIPELHQTELCFSITSLQSTCITHYLQNSIYFCIVKVSSLCLLDIFLCPDHSIYPPTWSPAEMANEGERPTSADKGKGKVDDVREQTDKNAEKGEKPSADANKKDGEPEDGTLR